MKAKGHNLSKTEAKAATETEPGNIEYWTCSVCGKVFSDAQGKTEIAQNDTVIAPTGHVTHSLSKVAAKEATCDADGNIEYWTCSGCGKLFGDADGQNEITQDEAVVKATGHNWGDWSVTKPATEDAEGEEMRTCKNDASHTETRTIAKLGTSSSGGCYVATSVYGSYDCPEVWTLRRFRDDVLAQTWYGRLFIRLYYAVSPTAVRLFGDCQWFQNFFRDRLDKMVSELQADGFESTPYEDRAW